jgi:rSAM/selenodomain-associated transferase 1
VRLIVMARHPIPGRVKTRLARLFGDDAACDLHRAFVRDLAARLRALPWETTWAYWPPDAPFAALVPGFRCRPQEGADLGERMARAIDAALAEARGPVAVIGVDSPHLPAARFAETAEALAAGAELVIGPALDGGYYLLGLRASAPALFSGIAWGTATVREATLARAAALGLRTHLLAPDFDVDGADGLARLREVVARRTLPLPETARVLTRLPAPPGGDPDDSA